MGDLGQRPAGRHERPSLRIQKLRAQRGGRAAAAVVGRAAAQPQQAAQAQYSAQPQAGAAPWRSAGAYVDVPAELKKYKELLDMGAITQEEFEAKKKQLLEL